MKATINIGLLAAATGLLLNSAVAQMAQEPASAEITHQWHGPVRGLQRRPDGTSTSPNWSGYAVTGSSFTYAVGSWTVPTVNCGGSLTTYSANWVGIDGFPSTNPTVEQIGTESDCVNGVPEYYAWYEFYPEKQSRFPSLVVSAGDTISAEVRYDQANKNFYLTITDNKTGTYTTSGTAPTALRASAEWIAEAPAKPGAKKPLPLAPFGYASFGDDYTEVAHTCAASDSSTSGPISAFRSNVNQISMEYDSTDLAVASSLSSDGSSFSVDSTAINVTNVYGLPGTANVTVLNSSGDQIYFMPIDLPYSSTNSQSTSVNLFLNTQDLTFEGSPYTLVIQATGSSGFGPGFMNFTLTSTPDLLFSNGTDSFSGLTYENQSPVTVQFSKVPLEF